VIKSVKIAKILKGQLNFNLKIKGSNFRRFLPWRQKKPLKNYGKKCKNCENTKKKA
jgi:hypothetical protein